MPCPFAWLSKLFPDLVPPHGAPLTDRSCEALIRLLESAGLDWKTSLSELATRYGVTRPYDFQDVVALPPLTTLSASPLQFEAPYEPANGALPCSYASARYLVHEDAAKNHGEITGELRMRLGPGVAGTAQNTLHEEWRFGRITLSATTWPPELQRRPPVNTLYQREPRLHFATSIAVASDFPWIFPDTELGAVFESSATILAEPILEKDIAPAPARGNFIRVNTPNITARIPAGEWRAWRNDERGWFGISTPETTALFKGKTDQKLQLSRVHPARGPGGSSLAVVSGQNLYGETILHGATPTALDGIAETLRGFWGLPLSSSDDEDI